MNLAVANVCYHMRIPVANEKTCHVYNAAMGYVNITVFTEDLGFLSGVTTVLLQKT